MEYIKQVVKSLKAANGEPVHPDVSEFLQRYMSGKIGLLFSTAKGTPHLYSNLEDRWLTPRLAKMGLDERGMGWHSFKRFRKTWLRGRRCLEDINIVQSWTQISVSLSTATSASWSCVAVIQVSDPDGVALIYQYENQPLADATRTMHIHFGTAMLRVSDGNKLTGDYYAGRDRGTFGRISCCRLPRPIKQALGALRPRLTGSSSHQ